MRLVGKARKDPHGAIHGAEPNLKKSNQYTTISFYLFFVTGGVVGSRSHGFELEFQARVLINHRLSGLEWAQVETQPKQSLNGSVGFCKSPTQVAPPRLHLESFRIVGRWPKSIFKIYDLLSYIH